MSALRSFASAEAARAYDEIAAATSIEQLDVAVRRMYHNYDAIGEADASFLETLANRRRPLARATVAPNVRQISSVFDRAIGRFKSRQHPRSPDRKASRERRRTLGGSSNLPPSLRCQYSEGQRAVLAIIAGEIKRQGICDLPLDAVAAKAGVCRTTAQSTVHEARRLGHINVKERARPGRKNLTNVVTIISVEWRTWISRAPAAQCPTGSNLVSPTKNTDIKKLQSQNINKNQRRAVQKVPVADVRKVQRG